MFPDNSVENQQQQAETMQCEKPPAFTEKVTLNQVKFDTQFGALTGASYFKTMQENVRSSCKRCIKNFSSIVISFVPIFHWLPRYSIRDDLVNDIVGGLTVGIMNVPQSMAYALLVGLEPIYGLYTSLYSALFYMLFTTSRHNSLGTSAVVSLMVGNAIGSSLHFIKHMQHFSSSHGNDSSEVHSEEFSGDQVTRLEVAVTLTFCVGVIQLAMALLRLDFLMSYMSDEVVRGFTTAAAFHVLVSQLGKVFGLKAKSHEGFGAMILQAADILVQLPCANTATTATSVTTIIILYLCKNVVAVRVKKYFRFPIPFDFFVVVIGILLSRFLHMEKKWHMKVVGEIPIGLPPPSVPRLDLILYVISQAPAIAVVVVAVSVSMGKLFAKKHHYPFDVRQEFYAVGITEFALSFFPSWTGSVALSRALVNESAGTKTQLSTIFASSVLFLVIFLLGRFMYDLPLCFLACIIIVALKGMFVQFEDLPRLWRLSKIDFAIWVVTFTVTLVDSIVNGLLVGIIFALLTVIWKAQRLDVSELGCLNNETGTVYYRSVEQYRNCRYINRVVCLRISGPIIFLNIDRVRNRCMRAAGIRLDDPSARNGGNEGKIHVIQVRTSPQRETAPNSFSTSSEKRNSGLGFGKEIGPENFVSNDDGTKQLVVDLSAVPYIDIMGANLLKEIWMTTKQHSISTTYACATRQIFDLIKRCEFGDNLPLTAFYPSIEDALQSFWSQNDDNKVTRIKLLLPNAGH